MKDRYNEITITYFANLGNTLSVGALIVILFFIVLRYFSLGPLIS